MWITYSLLAAVFAGLTSILAKIGIKNVNSHLATAIRTVVVLIFAWLIVFINGNITNISLINQKSWLFLILSGFATGFSWLFFYKALQVGEASKVVPIDKLSIVITIIFATLFLNEDMTVYKVIGGVLITIGTILVIPKRNDKNDNKKNIWIIYALLAAVFAGLTSIFGKIGVSNVNSTLATAIRTIVVLFVSWFMVFLVKSEKQIKTLNKNNWLFLILSGLVTGLSWLFYYKALQIGEASKVSAVDKLSIVITIFLAFIFLKEKIDKKTFIGIIFIIVGTFVLIL